MTYSRESLRTYSRESLDAGTPGTRERPLRAVTLVAWVCGSECEVGGEGRGWRRQGRRWRRSVLSTSIPLVPMHTLLLVEYCR